MRGGLKVTAALLAVFAGLAVLTQGLARLAWRLAPRDPKTLAGAAEFVSLAGSSGTRETGVGPDSVPDTSRVSAGDGGRTASAYNVAFDVPERQPTETVGAHRLEEWPSGKPRRFAEAPTLAKKVSAGELPPVGERLPEDPLVVVPPQQMGPYGGTWVRFGNAPADVGIYQHRLTYEGFLRWDPAFREIWPNMANRWEIDDDAKTYTFWLRRGVRWSDGTPFTTRDILFWYEDIIQNKELTPVYPRELVRGDELVKLEALDDYTVRFRFKESHGLFLMYLASGGSMDMMNQPAHYLRRFHPAYVPVEELEAMAEEEGLDLWYELFGLRREWKNTECPRLWAWLIKDPPPAQPVAFERNPFYWKVDPEGNQLPYIDRMTFDIYDNETINLKFINGEMGMQGRHIQFQNYQLFMANRDSGGYRVLHWIDSAAGHNVLCLNLNHKDPVLRDIIGDKRFRIALSHAIDREAINEISFYGIGTPRQMSPPPGSPFADESYARAHTEYDPAAANALLDELGLEMGSDGIRRRPDGRKLVLRIETTTWNNTELLEMVAAFWARVGVKTEVKAQSRNLFERRIAASQHDVGVWGGADEMIPLTDPRWYFPFSPSSYQGIGYQQWYRTNGAKGEAPPPDIKRCMDLYGEIELTADLDEQVALFQRIIDLNKENLWVIGTIGQTPILVLAKDSFRNVPDVAVYGWVPRTPGNTAPECYAIADAGGGG